MAVTVVRTAIPAGTYLTQSSASATFLSQANALSSYAPLVPTHQTGFRNKIINGDFNIYQRGYGGSGIYTNTFIADRWITVSNFGTSHYSYMKTAVDNTFLLNAGFSNYVAFSNIVHGYSDTNQYLQQRIEDVSTLNGQTVTLSFYAKASSSTSFTPRFIQNFGSAGGSPSVTTTASSITLTTSWARYSVTVDIPSVLGKTIGYSSFLAVDVISLPASISIDITGVQLEAGTVATPFEHRPYGLELSLCQRYFAFSNIHSGYLASTVNAANAYNNHLIFYPVEMRVSPTVSLSFTNIDNATYGGLGTQTRRNFSYLWRYSGSSWEYCSFTSSYSASAEL